MLSLHPHLVLKALTEPDALLAVVFVLHEHLVYLGHLHATLDLFNLHVTLVQFSTLLPDCPFVAINELLRLGMRLSLTRHAGRHSRVDPF